MTGKRINLALTNVSINKLPFIIAIDQRLFEENGLDIQGYVTVRGAAHARRNGCLVNPCVIKDLTSGVVSTRGGTTVIYQQATDAIHCADQQVIIATTDHYVRWNIMSVSEIESPEQLKFMRLGYSSPGSMSHFIALAFVQRMGWDPIHDISLMARASIEELDAKIVQAIVVGEIPYVLSRTRGFRLLVDTTKWNVPIVGSGIAVRRVWLRENRDTASRVVKSLAEAVALMKTDRNVVVRALGAWYNIVDSNHLEYLLTTVDYLSPKPYPAILGVEKALELFDSNEVRKCKAAELCDVGIVRDLDESGFIDRLYG